MFCSEEEVLRYCVLNNFAFPDARVDGDPQFVVIDWQDSDLILHLDKYIPNWVRVYCFDFLVIADLKYRMTAQ